MNSAAVSADKKSTLLEQVQIPADCIARFIEQRHEFGNRDLSMLLNKFDQAVLTHGWQCAAVRLARVREPLYAMANSLQLWLDNATHRAFSLAFAVMMSRKGSALLLRYNSASVMARTCANSVFCCMA
ncbi:hypothetical protein [Phyllobacterium sophorae]|uniref:hypothetical protein n=1 Tax=Phyllobacterium sophorae TaxID=1520277 RepID=UPI001FDEBDE1|nr:hypothetical protein [Phyllobacterium sophorae]